MAISKLLVGPGKTLSQRVAPKPKRPWDKHKRLGMNMNLRRELSWMGQSLKEIKIMRRACFSLAALALCCTLASTAGQAALTRDEFPPRTTGDLINLCSAAKDDPLMTAAVNFCQGFAEGAVEVALSYQAVTRHGREPFCLPTPRPSHDAAVAAFSAWANADPNRLAEAPVIGLMRFLISQYPCPHPVAAQRGQK